MEGKGEAGNDLRADGVAIGKGIGKQDPDAGIIKGKGKSRSHLIREWTPPRDENLQHEAICKPAMVPDDDGLENVLVHVTSVSGEWLCSQVIPEHTLAIELEGQVQRQLCGNPPTRSFRLVYKWGEKGPYPAGTPHAGRTKVNMTIREVKAVERSADRQIWFTGYFIPLNTPVGPHHAYIRNNHLDHDLVDVLRRKKCVFGALVVMLFCLRCAYMYLLLQVFLRASCVCGRVCDSAMKARSSLRQAAL